MLPIVVFTTVVIVRLSAYERAAVERELMDTTIGLATDLDRTVRGTIATLDAMAQSRALDTDDLETFYAEAQRILPTQPHWRGVILVSSGGRQLLNTLRPVGASLPAISEPESFRQALETGQPAVGDLVRGTLNGAWAFPVRVPVIRAGRTTYLLTAIVTAEAFASVMGEARRSEWTRTLTDRKGVIGARTRRPELFVGRMATPAFVRRAAVDLRGSFRDTTIDGKDVYVAFTRAPLSGWTAAIAVPVQVVDGPPRRQLAAIGGLGIALLVVSGGGAFLFARRVARRIGDAAAAAEAIAHGEQPAAAHSSVEEVARLDQALQQSAELLRRRQAERDRFDREREELLQQAEAANRAKDDFLAMLSHELRTPLTAILGWAGMLRSGRLAAPAREQAMEVIQRNARLQRQLIDELLDVSRIVAGKLELDVAPTDLRTVVAAAVDTMRPAADAKGVVLECTACAEPAVVDGDAARLHQVVVNLLSNAVKFTPRAGRIDVAIRMTGRRAEISVIDTGRGIEPAFLPHIFDRFRQATVAATASRSGLGLGLAIVHHLVSLHGGMVRAHSAGEARGASFVVSLPLSVTADRFRLGPTPADVDDQALASMRVLVVDDEPDTVEMLAAALELHQAVVARARSADQALAALESFAPDVIISDIRMPGTDGYALIEEVRRREKGARARVAAIALTANAGVEDRDRARRAGFDLHIAKPVDPRELVTALLALSPRAAAPNA